MRFSEFEADFTARSVPYSGGLLLLHPHDAIELIRRAAELHIAILGVDGLLVSPTTSVSPLEHVADFSTSNARCVGRWAEAEEFITSRRDLDLVFEVTLGPHLGHTTQGSFN